MKKYLLTLCGLLSAAALSGAEPLIPIFTKQDPGISVDGFLEKNDWDDIKYQFKFPDKVPPSRFLIVSQSKWKSVKDLSGTVKLAWRTEGIYLGAEVIDDKFYQTERGTLMFKGDHIELFIDTIPGIDTARNNFGSGQYHILLSPGNLNTKNSKPEAVLAHPQRRGLPEIRIAARKTGKGYTLEALIPWSVIGWKKAPQLSENKVIGLEIMISDNDSVQPNQEKILFAGKSPWARTRKRMLKAVFTDAKGTLPSSISSSSAQKLITKPQILHNNKKLPLSFELSAMPENVIPVLKFKAYNRTTAPWFAGSAPTLYAEVNGKGLTPAQLLDKPLQATLVNGRLMRLMSLQNRIRLPYLPNLKRLPKIGDKNYPFRDAFDMTLYRFSLDKLARPGKNTIVFSLNDKVKHRAIQFLEVSIEYITRQAARTYREAPKGKIPVFVPKKQFKTPYKVTSVSGGKIAFETARNPMFLESRFSTPGGKYVTGSNRFFKMERKIEKKGELFIVRDTFTNLTKEDLPLIQHYELSGTGKLNEIRLGGLEVSPALQDYVKSYNCTTFMKFPRGGAGICPLSDIFMVHAESYVKDRKKGGICDRYLVLRPGTTMTTELAVVPVADGNYYSFINAMRRELQMNYTIPGPITTLPDWWVWYWNKGPRGDKKRIKKFLDLRDAKLIWTGFNVSGPTIHRTWRNNEKKAHELNRIAKECRPQAMRSGYFHCFIDWTDRTKGMYPADEVHNKAGKQECYNMSKPSGIFIPTLTNGVGKDTEKNLDYMLKEFKNDTEFFYWDEFNSSKLRYSYNKKQWDGCSADIDQKTGKIIRKKTSLTLYSYEWRRKMIRKIKKQYPLIMINGSFPLGKEMRKEKFICFTETAQATNAARVQLSTPVGLGDHYTDDTELICYNQMLELLNYGVLYYWYSPKAVMTRHALPKYMFPATPMELGNGFIICKERIVTKVSGYWGWGDKSKHEVHVFDRNGWENTAFKAPQRIINGQTFTELRLPEGWSAAIVRK